MKNPIKWHQQCLANNKLFLQRKEEELVELTSVIEITKKEIEEYEIQIELAIDLNKDGFDQDKFGKAKK